jgi:hypothetical protein
MTSIELLVINLSQLLAMVLAVAVPVYRAFVTGRFWSSVGFMYFCLVLWGFTVCFFLPGFLGFAFQDKQVYDHFPDGPGAAVTLFMGWLPSVVFCGIALGIRGLWRLARRSRSNAPGS